MDNKVKIEETRELIKKLEDQREESRTKSREITNEVITARKLLRKLLEEEYSPEDYLKKYFKTNEVYLYVKEYHKDDKTFGCILVEKYIGSVDDCYTCVRTFSDLDALETCTAEEFNKVYEQFKL